MHSRHWIYFFFISLLTALEEFHISLVVWQIRILKSASLSLWPCSSSNGGGMHSTGYAGFGALRAMFLSCRQKWPCWLSTLAWQWHVAPGFAGISALRAAFPTIAGVSMCSLLCTSWFMA